MINMIWTLATPIVKCVYPSSLTIASALIRVRIWKFLAQWYTWFKRSEIAENGAIFNAVVS